MLARLPQLRTRLKHTMANRELDSTIQRIELEVQAQEQLVSEPPVFVFNASTRIHHLSLNGAYSLLAAWGLRLAGVDVRYLVCSEGMEQCVLGTHPDNLGSLPPCSSCIKRSNAFFPQNRVASIERNWAVHQDASDQLANLDLEQLENWETGDLPLGKLCLPGLRWALRRHNLSDGTATLTLFRQYLASAASLAVRFEELFESYEPSTLLLFNGIFYPEAVAREVAVRRGLPVVTHEVGLQPQSTYFTYEEATFRDLDQAQPPTLSPDEDSRLDRYLAERRIGKFTMAGIGFWPDMRPLPPGLLTAVESHEGVLSVFTNVVFDTSQVHANTIFSDMFAWLDQLKITIRAHPELLFVVRAHPDEDRLGKASRESVSTWIGLSGLADQSNVRFFGPGDQVDSYALIEISQAVLTYNSSIGLEAAIMGKPVLLAGRARYSESGAVIAPADQEQFDRSLKTLLSQPSDLLPPEGVIAGRGFLYHELYRASLDLSEFLSPYPDAPGMVSLSDFSATDLAQSEAINTIVKGITERQAFIIREAAFETAPG